MRTKKRAPKRATPKKRIPAKKKATPKKRITAKKNVTPKKRILTTRGKKHQLFCINMETGQTGEALRRTFNTRWAPNTVTLSMVYRTVTPKNVEAWNHAEFETDFANLKKKVHYLLRSFGGATFSKIWIFGKFSVGKP